MKRFLAILMVLMMACATAYAEGLVVPTELNEDETNLLSLMGWDIDTAIFDFTAPEGAKTALLTLWQLEDGEWVLLSERALSMEEFGKQGRVALHSKEYLGGDLYMSLWTVDGWVSGTEGMEPEFDLWSMNISTDILFEQRDAVLNQQIPLMMQCLSSQEEMTDADLMLYQTPDAITNSEYIYVVTLNFSELTEAELYDWDAEEWPDEEWPDDFEWSDEEAE